MFRYTYQVCFFYQLFLYQLGVEYNTFQPKEKRSSHIVIKNLHPAADQKVITDELEEREHKTFAFAYNIIIYLVLFLVDLDPFLDNKKIFTINSSYKIYVAKKRRYSYPEKGIKDLPRPWAYSQLLSHNLQMCEMYKESPDFR